MIENDYSKMMPRMLSGEELMNTLKVIPQYSPSFKEMTTPERLLRLSDIYKIYLPSAMSKEIYNRLYLATAMSLQKKGTRLSVIQQNSNFKGIQSNEYRGIIGGADSFTVIGTSGIGKSSAIDRAVNIICGGKIIEMEKPFTQIIPCLSVQCPYDCSPKGMLLEILRMVDTILDTRYYERSQRAGVTTDILIGTVSQVAINHIGLLIIDEIQNVSGHKSGNTLIAMLTQLINQSGISICMVGTPDSIYFFERSMQLSRRSMGLKYSTLPYDDYFSEFCTLVFGYQYVRKETEITDAEIEWLYEHSSGIISVVISLIHDAQELAIFNGREILDIQSLNEAFTQRLTMLHEYVAPEKTVERTRMPKQKEIRAIHSTEPHTTPDYLSIMDIVKKSKDEGRDIISILREYLTVTEVAV